MKKAILLVTTLATFLISCSDDDSNSVNGIQLQAHDQNKMMGLMHNMMTEMESMEMTNDPDIDFAAMMIMHHEGAITMSNLELAEGANAEMKGKAQAIIAEQQQEQQQMQAILNGLTADDMDMDFAMEQMEQMDKMDAMADEQMITGDIDNDFATLMIIHHQAAIDNASAYLHHGNHPELLEMAHMMIDAQNAEIIELSAWLQNNRR